MIGELLRYWTTFAPERVRKFGYLKRLITLEFKARRCRDAWSTHLTKTRALIVKAADLVEQPRIAVIVGSGLLLDVPLQELAGRFDKIYLIDIFHMPHVRKAARRYFNVKLLTGDVTGIFAMLKEGRTPGLLTPPPAARIPHIAEADFVVSCNCLTHLAGPFVTYVRKTQGLVAADCDVLSAQIMEKHIEAIARDAPGLAVIITETESFSMRGAEVVARSDLLKGVRLPPTPHQLHNEEWEWLISPKPEEHATQDVVHLVSARVYERGAAADVDLAAPMIEAISDVLPASDGDGLEDLPEAPRL